MAQTYEMTRFGEWLMAQDFESLSALTRSLGCPQLVHVTPRLAVHYLPDGGITNAEPTSQRTRTKLPMATDIDAADRSHIILRQLGDGDAFTPSTSATLNLVDHVVLLGAEKKVPRVAACGVIACVAHDFISRDITMMQDVHSTMDLHALSPHLEGSVPTLIHWPGERPASIRASRHVEPRCQTVKDC